MFRRWCCCHADQSNQVVSQVPRKLSLEEREAALRPKAADMYRPVKVYADQQRVDRIIKQVEIDSLNRRVSIDNTPDFLAELSLANQQFGMDIRVDQQQYVLKVGALKETGAVVSWNEANPDKLIEVGDTIVMVNGETEMTKMLKKKTKDKKFVMAIKKTSNTTAET
mmetsp:Transcript_37017/g.98611  ORF Transcript_37017/g.98611 Transcript_37017/m.98611 type:complete len:167 (-) Transcript_37017:234-734(-)